MLSCSYADLPWSKVDVQHIDKVSTQTPALGHFCTYHCRSETTMLVYSYIGKTDIYPRVTPISRHLALGALLGPFAFNIPYKTDDNSNVSYPHLHYFKAFSVPKWHISSVHNSLGFVPMLKLLWVHFKMSLSKYSITSYNSQLSTTEPTSLPCICSLACLDDSYHLSVQPHNPKDTNLSPEARTEKQDFTSVRGSWSPFPHPTHPATPALVPSPEPGSSLGPAELGDNSSFHFRYCLVQSLAFAGLWANINSINIYTFHNSEISTCYKLLIVDF